MNQQYLDWYSIRIANKDKHLKYILLTHQQQVFFPSTELLHITVYISNQRQLIILSLKKQNEKVRREKRIFEKSDLKSDISNIHLSVNRFPAPKDNQTLDVTWNVNRFTRVSLFKT